MGIRLRIDSPYPGESMSSFLARTAQFYATPPAALLKELLQEQKWSSLDCRDIDLAAPPLLEQRLSEAVPGWRSPLSEHQGFMQWTLGQYRRYAYCPTCFLEDLAEQRTPYFRNDWIPVLVTTCWKHETPLFDWGMLRYNGWRQWPTSWIYKMESASHDVPEFMQHHLKLLAQLGTSTKPGIDVGGEFSASEAFAYLRGLQILTEKPSAVSMPPSEPFKTELGAFRILARELVRLASRHQHSYKEPPIAAVICPPEGSTWIASIPGDAARRRWELCDLGIRQTGCIGWRRCYLLFAARTLLGMDRFHSIFPSISPIPLSPWRDWWREVVFPRLGPEQRDILSWYLRRNLHIG